MPQLKELFSRWEKERADLRIEFVAGNIGVAFTGRVTYHSSTELRLGRGDDEVSVSLFCATVDHLETIRGTPAAEQYFREHYACAVRIVTDAGAACMVYELRERGARALN